MSSITSYIPESCAYFYSYLDECINYKTFNQDTDKINEYRKNTLKRIISISIPFLTLFKPFKVVKDCIKSFILVTKNGYKILKNKISIQKKLLLILQIFAKISLFFCTLLSFKTGLIISGALFTLKFSVCIAKNIRSKKYKKGTHKLLNLISITGTISVLVLESLKLSCALLIFKIALTAYKGGYEFSSNKIPEGVGKIAKSFLGLNRLYYKITKII